MAYVDMFVGPVANDMKEAYRAYAAAMNALTEKAGALSATACWAAEDTPGLPNNPLATAAKVEDGESLVTRIVRWPSKAAREEGWAKMMKSPDMQAAASLFQLDRSRILHGAFEELGAE